jgi:hypothetical protein
VLTANKIIYLSVARLRPGTLVFLVLAAVFPVASQELPDKIRGYRVHGEKVSVSNVRPEKGGTILVLSEPEITSVSLTGVTLAVSGAVESAGYEGRVEMLMFRDFRVNGVAVEISEFNEPFPLSKKGRTELPGRAIAFIPTTSIARAAWKEWSGSNAEWVVTGKVFVFGRFKKFGFSFKRVVPVDVRLMIKNPLS